MKIGIIVAMRKELDLLLPLLKNSEQSRMSGFEFYCGTVGKHNVMVMQCGIGKVNAAMGTVSMIANYSPQLIINTGVAGGMNNKVNVMDLVVGSKVCYHDVWCGFDGVSVHGQVQGLPLYYEASSKVLDMVPEKEGIHCGLIVSGDQFIDNIEDINKIREHFPQALAVDMESGAIAHTCYVRNTPFVSMRIISDSPGAGHNNTNQYNDFWAEAPQHTLSAVRRLLEMLH
jgi:adenosylhomocysteine nucleosidase